MILVCCASGCLAADAADAAQRQRCGLEGRRRRSGLVPTAVVREVPRKGQGAMQAHTVSKEDEDDNWAPIRIKVSAREMYDSLRHCTAAGDLRVDHGGRPITSESDEVLMEEMRDIILRQMLPAAAKLHSERLSVRPVTDLTVLPRTNLGLCDKFTIPRKHCTVGVEGAEMILYVKAFPTSGELAWTIRCAFLEDGLLFAAAVKFDPKVIATTNIRVLPAAHVLGHALGLASELFFAFNMISEVPKVRGKLKVAVISSPRVKEMVRS
ncbi:surface protease GP63 [Trypanosoma cruzi]|nr:surface protease GP63 [Trypanosoma cruzi]